MSMVRVACVVLLSCLKPGPVLPVVTVAPASATCSLPPSVSHGSSGLLARIRADLMAAVPLQPLSKPPSV